MVSSNETSASRLEVRNLTVAFGPHVIQQDLSFQVRARSIFAVMGGSGCGKSTVLKAMMGLLSPAAGTVLVDGEDYGAAEVGRAATSAVVAGIIGVIALDAVFAACTNALRI